MRGRYSETVLTAFALAISLDIVQERASSRDIIARYLWLLSVTESVVLPP